jgi:hypothetical protein
LVAEQAGLSGEQGRLIDEQSRWFGEQARSLGQPPSKLGEQAGLVATQRHAFGTESSVMINGTAFEPSEIKAMVRAHLDEQDALDRLHSEWLIRLAGLKQSFSSSLEPMLLGIERLVTGKYGVAARVAEDFGFKIPKKPYRSAVNKLLAAQRAIATRKARGTLGKRKRLAIHGLLTQDDINDAMAKAMGGPLPDRPPTE